MITKATGIILAGGASRRFGSNKALAPWSNGQKLVERVCSIMASLFPRNLIMVKSPLEFDFLDRPGVDVHQDQFPQTHCLGGIYSGLRRIQTATAFVCGCDMPHLQPKLVHAMWEKMGQDYDAVVPVWQSRIQPLCGFYSRNCLEALQTMAAEKRFRVGDLFSVIRTRFFQPEEIMKADPQGLSFLDVDTPEDYKKAISLR